MYLGTTGSGKSFAAKREIVNVFLATPDKIIIVDPMGEYAPLVKRLGGEVIEISPDSPHHINPLDLKMSDTDEENPLSIKADFILSLMELVVAGKDGLQPIEKTVIDRCTRLVYRDVLNNPGTAPMPTLQDLHALLSEQPEPEAKRLAVALEIYVSGSLNVFNHQTNVDTGSRIICFVLNRLGAGLRKLAMHITNELTRTAVEENFRKGLRTWGYYDEFHVLLQDRLVAGYFVSIWRMLRKRGCVPTALTQNVKSFLASREIEDILENTEFLVLLSQAAGDREILANKLGISSHQLSYVTHSNSGEGVLYKRGLHKSSNTRRNRLIRGSMKRFWGKGMIMLNQAAQAAYRIEAKAGAAAPEKPDRRPLPFPAHQNQPAIPQAIRGKLNACKRFFRKIIPYAVANREALPLHMV